jgi:hypothetical protein
LLGELTVPEVVAAPSSVTFSDPLSKRVLPQRPEDALLLVEEYPQPLQAWRQQVLELIASGLTVSSTVVITKEVAAADGQVSQFGKAAQICKGTVGGVPSDLFKA